MTVPLAHLAGLPLEEILGSGGPALLAALTAIACRFRARAGRRARTAVTPFRSKFRF